MNLQKAYDEMKNAAFKILDEERYAHSINVENEAVKLSKIYNVDAEKCRFAAIAHDYAKAMSDCELINCSEKYEIQTDTIQRNFPQLLHGPVAAMYCKNIMGIDDEDIINAIYYHTTGRENMSLLEKIIYISDVIEVGRDFPGIDDIRKEALVDIDNAILLSCNSTISYVIARNFLIHPLTIALRNSIILKGGVSNGKA